MIKFLQSKNIDLIINFHDTYEDNNDMWLIFEMGGNSLSSLCWKIKGEFIGSERIYSIFKGHLLHKLTTDLSQLKFFMREMLEFIHKLNQSNIVHSDIKPDNILIQYNKENFTIESIKIIDFGSAYFLDNPPAFSSNTPEYMSPEITSLLENTIKTSETTEFLKSLMKWPWCIDIWSLGVMLLEIVLACPIWMSYKAKVMIRGKTIFKTGLFGIKGRDSNKIYSKQCEMVKNLKKLLMDSLIDDDSERDLFADLIGKMLELDYKTRISPIDALKHPFFQETNSFIDKNELKEEFQENKLITPIKL